MRLKQPKRSDSLIPTASMADIAFLLIVFFMITTSITVDRTAVALPTSLERTEVPKDAAVVAVERDGVVHFSDGAEQSHVINMSDVLPAAAFVIEKNSLMWFIVKADGDAQYQFVDQVMEQLRQASVRNIAMLTQQEGVE